MSIQLYSYFRSSCSYRVRIGLNLKKLPYEILPVHLVKEGGEQFSSAYTELNPSQKVPTLIHEGTAFAQSVAIFEYLETAFPEVALYPKLKAPLAQFRQMIEIINSDIQPLQNLRVLKHLVKNFQLDSTQKEEWIRHWIGDGFSALETMVATTSDSGNFSFGNSPSALDCFLVPQVYNAERFNLDMSRFPTLSSVNKNCLSLPDFIKAHPDNQPDSPGKA